MLLCAATANGEAAPGMSAASPPARAVTEGAPPRERVDASGQAASSRESGIEGCVTIGPTTPVARAGEPNARPYQTTLLVLDANGREVTRFKTDADGCFRVRVEPGTYRLRSEARGPFPRAPNRTVTVPAGTVTHVDLSVDSGIRGLQQR